MTKNTFQLKNNPNNSTKNNISKYKIFIIFFIILYLIYSFTFISDKRYTDNFYNNLKISHLIKNNISLNEFACKFIKNELENRVKPFEFETELYFFISLISCKIPFSFSRFGDGEASIMKGNKVVAIADKWRWELKNQKIREGLIESSNICTNYNNYIGIPCKNWINVSKTILSYSNCSSSKFMSYATVFINNNFYIFKNWLINFINNSNRWKIILVANSKINLNISWAYKFYNIPDHIVEIWDQFRIDLLSKLSEEAKKSDLIFFISAGPAANIIVSYLTKINNKNIYIDLGSSIEFITKGYSTRPYSDKKSKYATQKCESFIIKEKVIYYENK